MLKEVELVQLYHILTRTLMFNPRYHFVSTKVGNTMHANLDKMAK